MSKFRKAATGMTLAEHLAEARQRFMICTAAVLVLGTLAFIFYGHLLHVLQEPYCRAAPKHCLFLATNPLDGLTLRIKIAFFGGFVLALPILLWETWRFITPGLKARERRYALPFVLSSLAFFFGGVVLAYFIFQRAISWLESIGGHTLIYEYNPNQYLSLFVLMMVIFGLTFEFPVVLVALELAGLVTPRTLLRGWRYALITITVFAAVITPSSDPFSMLALAIPLTVFYFMAIGVGKLLKK
ncbi:MAG: twin-arginine translocase subunit TatC [Acidimicrobiales bacterium]